MGKASSGGLRKWWRATRRRRPGARSRTRTPNGDCATYSSSMESDLILMTYGKGQFWRLAEMVARNSEAETGCPVTYTYTKRELRHLLEQHGFHVKQMHAEHIFPYRIQDYVQYRYI